ncbi:Flp family type IVb pilin [Muricoccus radiodurans]|uniref:Flp family type IVb pilin n=1 Tax=Muricoccus radiodurans TaxID=2231721 RepID=UPI003CEDBFC5
MNDLAPARRGAHKLLKDRRGVTALEYGLIAAFLSVVLIAVVPGLAEGLRTTFTRITGSLT